MKTVYSNTSNPKLIKWSSILAFIVGIILFVIYIIEVSRNEGVRLFLYCASFLLMYGALVYGQYKLITVTID